MTGIPVRLVIAAPALLAALCLQNCGGNANSSRAAIRITRVPQADSAGGNQTEVIQGDAAGAGKGDRVILYAQAGDWWVQPLEKQPVTALNSRMRWINGTHLGTKYAALLVGPGYKPENRLTALPSAGGSVKAVAVKPGLDHPASPYISFSGYRWRTRNAVSNRGGTNNQYSSENAWTDAAGALHLKITGGPKDWTCSEITLAQSLGYGTYTFEVKDFSNLEPSAVFAFFTYDYAGGNQNSREVNFEVSRWGDPSVKNGQYVVQPFYVPENVSRFYIPPGLSVHSLEWGPGHITFRSLTKSGKVISQHAFVSGTPEPGLESARMAFYVYNEGPQKQLHPAEVVIERFQYLP